MHMIEKMNSLIEIERSLEIELQQKSTSTENIMQPMSTLLTNLETLFTSLKKSNTQKTITS